MSVCRLFGLVPVVALSGWSGGCQIEQLFADDVGAGAARLSVRNAAVLAKAIDDDLDCGFDSERVKYGFTVDGNVGELGSVTWKVERCTVDFGEMHVVTTDCNGDTRSISGKATASATRTVRGVITGNNDSPVIPMDNSAVDLSYEADVDNWGVRLSHSKNAAVWKKGHIEFDANVHLARSESMGVCAVDTSEMTLRKLKVTNAEVEIDQDGHVFNVPLPLVEVSAQMGQFNGKENVIAGTATVWDHTTDVAKNDKALDPDYERSYFQSSYACKDDLKLPQDYQCPDITDTIGNGAARLLLNNVGNAVQLAVSNTTCGFASPAVTANARVTGEIGRDGGEVAFTIQNDCVIDLPQQTVISQNCLGTQTKAQGRVKVRGTMTQRGRLTGDPAQPVIPTSRDAVDIVFDVTFDGWSVTTDGEKYFVADAGGVTGRMKPRLALDSSSGACSLPTAVVTFDNIAAKPNTSGILHSGLIAVRTDISASRMQAQVNNKDGTQNHLSGDITIDILGQGARSVDVTGPLDPAYDPNTATAQYSCTPNLVIPVDDDACSFSDVIAHNSARLAVATTGTLASMINGDSSCGFEDMLGVLISPSDVQGASGEMGSITWDVRECGISLRDDSELSRDCTGGVTYAEGAANFVDVGRTVRGEREKKFFIVDSIIPRASASVDLHLRTVELTNFSTWIIAPGRSEPDGVLIIHQGTLSATVQPATGARPDDPTTFDVATPIARLPSIRLQAEATLLAQGKTFHFTIDDAQLQATNGSFQGAENQLTGTIMIDGELHTLGTLPLNPSYNATSFHQSYMCNVAGPVGG